LPTETGAQAVLFVLVEGDELMLGGLVQELTYSIYHEIEQVHYIVICSRKRGSLNLLRFADRIFTRAREMESPLTNAVISVTYLREASKMAET
jgi:hypothetical protein